MVPPSNGVESKINKYGNLVKSIKHNSHPMILYEQYNESAKTHGQKKSPDRLVLSFRSEEKWISHLTYAYKKMHLEK